MCSIKLIINNQIKGINFLNRGYAIEVSCNRQDEHSISGEHSFKNNEFEIKWNVLEEPWFANN